jgi:ribosomal protein S18 acetylase RimI-like enzyme
LRFAGGYTRRANSVNPLAAQPGNLVEAIETAEERFRERGLLVVFKLTEASQPPELDRVLEERGYERAAATRVMTLPVGAFPVAADSSLELSGQLREDWLDTFSEWQDLRTQRTHHREILERIVVPHRFATLRDSDGPVALGLAVRDGGLGGLYDVVTSPSRRRLGYGERVVRGLLAWAQGEGARRAYLQVLETNEPAFRLYTRLGFRETYRYWYRIAP